ATRPHRAGAGATDGFVTAGVGIRRFSDASAHRPQAPPSTAAGRWPGSVPGAPPRARGKRLPRRGLRRAARARDDRSCARAPRAGSGVPGLARLVLLAAGRWQPGGKRPARGQGEHLERGESAMETVLREAKETNNEVSASIKEQIVLEHAPLIRYIVNRIAVRLPSHIDLDDLHNTGVIGLMDAIEKY